MNNNFQQNLSLIRDTELSGAGVVFNNIHPLANEADPKLKLATPVSKKSLKTNLKKQAPIIALFLLLSAIVVGVLALLSPATLIIHITQTIVDKFDTQRASAEARSNLLLNTKWVDHQPSSPYKIINDYRHIPENLVKNLQSEGFSIHTQNGQISQVFFKNKPISRQDFLNKLRTDIEINEAKNNSYNSRRVLFQDLAWQKNAHNLRLSKTGFTKPSGDRPIDDLKQQEIEITKITEPQMRFNTVTPTETDRDGQTHEQQSPSISIFKTLTNNLKYINQQADKIAQSNESPYYKSFDNLKITESDFVNNQSACGLYYNSKFLQNYAKTPQAGQQSRLALNLFVEAEKIKAGMATPESAEFYGKRLTDTFTTTKPGGVVVETKAGTDSVGYKYAAFGDVLKLNESAERYVIGANPTIANSLKTISNQANQCTHQGGILQRILTSFFSNIAHLLNPFFVNNNLLNNLLNSGKSRQLTESTIAAMSHSGITPQTSGEDLVNATVASSGHAFGRLAAIGGNNILSKTQATAYLQEQQKYLAMQSQIEAKNHSPFDINSKHTLFGNIVHNNLHLFSKIASVRSFGQSILKSAKISLASINPISQAKNATFNHNHCQDPALLKLNHHFRGDEIALDIFCNPVYGVDPNALQIDPITVVIRLINSGELVKTNPDCQENCELQLTGGLLKYQKNCINRAKLPIGDSDEEAGLDDGESCIANSPQKSLYALYFIDQRLQNIFNEIKPL